MIGKRLFAVNLALLIIVSTIFTSSAFADKEDESRGCTVKIRPLITEFPGLAKIDYQKAADIALKQVPGGILEIELENEGGYLVYSMEIAGADKISECIIDAGNGDILLSKTEDEASESKGGKCHGNDEEDSIKPGSIKISYSVLELPGLAKIDYKKAIEAAMKKIPGQFLSLALEDDNGFLIYEVLLVSKGEIMEIEVDAGNGAILKVEEMEEEEEKD